MFGVTGTGLAAFRAYQNDNKRARYNLDQWGRVRSQIVQLKPIANQPFSKVRTSVTASNDNRLTLETTVMERDFRLTGSKRGQIGNAEAPVGFEFSNRWKVGILAVVLEDCPLTKQTARAANHIDSGLYETFRQNGRSSCDCTTNIREPGDTRKRRVRLVLGNRLQKCTYFIDVLQQPIIM